MTNTTKLQNEELFRKIRVMSNQYRFRILELTQDKELNITSLSKILGLSYTKCVDYIKILEKEGLIEKTKIKRETFIRSHLRRFPNK